MKIQPKLLNRFVPGGTKRIKGKIQDLIDSVLRVTYPYISEGKGWTKMMQDIPFDRKHVSLTVDPNLLPDGEEDGAELLLGRKQEGEEVDILRVKIWRKDGMVVLASKKSRQEFS